MVKYEASVSLYICMYRCFYIYKHEMCVLRWSDTGSIHQSPFTVCSPSAFVCALWGAFYDVGGGAGRGSVEAAVGGFVG